MKLVDYIPQLQDPLQRKLIILQSVKSSVMLEGMDEAEKKSDEEIKKVKNELIKREQEG